MKTDTSPEAIRYHLENMRDGYAQRASQQDEAAYMYEGAANADGVGNDARHRSLEFAMAFAERANRSRRNAEILTAALALMFEAEKI